MSDHTPDQTPAKLPDSASASPQVRGVAEMPNLGLTDEQIEERTEEFGALAMLGADPYTTKSRAALCRRWDAWLAAVAPHIADSVRRELLADTYTAEGGEIVMRELGRVKAERDRALAGIEALRDEWQAAANAAFAAYPNPIGMRDGFPRGYASAQSVHADALDALLPERAR